MKNERKTEIKVGITVIVALFFLVWIMGWAKNLSLHSDRKFLNVKFQSVSGLEIGDQVTVSGVRRGYVDNIISKANIVFVRLSLERDVDLRNDAVFSVEMLDLMGGKKVEIAPGTSTDALDFNVIASGDFSADIPSMMKMAGMLSRDFPAIMIDIKATLNALKDYLTDANLRENLTATLTEVKEITIQVNSFIKENRSDMSSLISGSNTLVKESGDFIKKTSTQIDQSLVEVTAVSGKVQGLMEKLDGLMVETKEKKNNLGKALYDETLLNDTKELLKSLQETLKLLHNQLKNEGVNVKAKFDLF